jgi:hypothetical protein
MRKLVGERKGRKEGGLSALEISGALLEEFGSHYQVTTIISVK